MSEKTVHEQYLETIDRHTEAVQKTGAIPETYSYEHGGHKWLLMLPRSVMAQKQLIHARNEYFVKGTYDTEEALLKLMAANSKVDGRDVNLNQLTIGELEVLKVAYLDGLLLPLSLGGENAVLTYKKNAVENLK